MLSCYTLDISGMHLFCNQKNPWYFTYFSQEIIPKINSKSYVETKYFPIFLDTDDDDGLVIYGSFNII